MNVYDRSGERLIIMDVREALVQPTDAADWTDLRVGFMLSLTSSSANDSISNLAANIVSPVQGLPPTDLYWIGLKDSSDVFPSSVGTQFIGFTNSAGLTGRDNGDSLLVSSDGGIGTTNANYYRPSRNGFGSHFTFQVYDGPRSRGHGETQSQAHFIQNNTSAYTTCMAFRLTRPDTRSNARQITTQIAKLRGGLSSGDLEYTNNPSAIELQNQLSNFPTLVQQIGPSSMSEVPDTLFCYTPWSTSRLRIHAAGVYSVT
jgi:hypothetical protein